MWVASFYAPCESPPPPPNEKSVTEFVGMYKCAYNPSRNHQVQMMLPQKILWINEPQKIKQIALCTNLLSGILFNGLPSYKNILTLKFYLN